MSSDEVDGLSFPRVRPRLVCFKTFSCVSKRMCNKLSSVQFSSELNARVLNLHVQYEIAVVR